MRKAAPRLQVVAIIGRTCGEPALRQLLPLLAGLSIVAAVLFGPNGASAADITGLAEHSMPVAAALWVGWFAGTAGAVRTAARCDGAIYLRPLPIGRWLHWLLPALFIVAAQLPIGFIFLRGASAADGLGAIAIGAGGGSLLALSPRSALERITHAVLTIGVLALVVFGLARQPLAVAAVGAVLFGVAFPTAWLRAPQGEGGIRPRRLRGGVIGAIAMTATSYLARQRSGTLAKAVIATLGGAVATIVIAEANELDVGSTTTLALGSAAIAIPVGMRSTAAALMENERTSRWIFDSIGLSQSSRVLGALTPAALQGLLMGLALGVAECWWMHTWSSALLAATAASGLSWAAIALAIARLCDRAAGVDGTLLLGGLTLSSIASVVGFALVGQATLLAVATVALGATIATADRAERSRLDGVASEAH